MLAITALYILAMMRAIAAAFNLELYVFSDIRRVKLDATAESSANFCNS